MINYQFPLYSKRKAAGMPMLLYYYTYSLLILLFKKKNNFFTIILFLFTPSFFRIFQKHEFSFSDSIWSVIFLRETCVHGLSMDTCFPTTHSKCSCRLFGMNTIFKSLLGSSLDCTISKKEKNQTRFCNTIT